MTAIVRVDLGLHAAELANQPIIVNGEELGRTRGAVTDVEVGPGWSIIVLGHGWDQTAPARFHAYDHDIVEVDVFRFEDGIVPGGGLLGGRFGLRVTHPQPTPPDPEAAV